MGSIDALVEPLIEKRRVFSRHSDSILKEFEGYPRLELIANLLFKAADVAEHDYSSFQNIAEFPVKLKRKGETPMTITSASSAITKTLSSTQDIGLGAQLAQGLLSYSKESLLLVSQEISPGQAYGDATSSVHVARTFGDSSVSRVIMGHTQDKQLLVRTIGRIAGYAGSTVATRAAKLMSEESSAEDFLALTKRSKDKEVIKRVVYAGLCESPYFKQDLGMLHYMSLRIGPASLIPFAHALLDYRDQPSDQVHARLLANAQSIHNLVYRQKAVDYVNKTRR